MIYIIYIIGITFLGVTFGFIELNQKSDRGLIRKWHKTKALFQIFIAGAISVAIHGFATCALTELVVLLAITAIVFNISINITRKRKSILYLSKDGLEGIFYKSPWLYYLILVLIIVFLTAII